MSCGDGLSSPCRDRRYYSCVRRRHACEFTDFSCDRGVNASVGRKIVSGAGFPLAVETRFSYVGNVSGFVGRNPTSCGGFRACVAAKSVRETVSFHPHKKELPWGIRSLGTPSFGDGHPRPDRPNVSAPCAADRRSQKPPPFTHRSRKEENREHAQRLVHAFPRDPDCVVPRPDSKTTTARRSVHWRKR